MDVTITPGVLLIAAGLWLLWTAAALALGGQLFGRRCRRPHAAVEAEPTVPLDLLPGRHRPDAAPLAATVAATRPRVPSPPPPAWVTAPTGRQPHMDARAVIADARTRRHAGGAA